MFTNGENLTAKTSLGDFQVTTTKTPLLSQQAITSKGIPSTLPTYSWTLTPIPNWTYSIETVPLFDAQLPSIWLTSCTDPNTRLQSSTKKVVGCKFFNLSTWWRLRRWLVTKPKGTHTQQLLHKNDELGQELCLRLQIAWTEFSQCLCNLSTYWQPLK